MGEVEGIDRGEVIVFDEPDLERAHEPRRGHRKVVTHQDKTLDVGPIALPQGPNELSSCAAGIIIGVQPLFELVEHNQDFGARRQKHAAAYAGNRLGKAQLIGTAAGHATQRSEKPRLRGAWRRLDIDGRHIGRRKPAQEPCLDHRRLAAAAGTAEQAHGEWIFVFTGLNPRLPEP